MAGAGRGLFHFVFLSPDFALPSKTGIGRDGASTLRSRPLRRTVCAVTAPFRRGSGPKHTSVFAQFVPPAGRRWEQRSALSLPLISCAQLWLLG